jgi:hypothetical protein
MVDQKVVELVSRLHKNTQEKKITWTPTFDRNAFDATFPRYNVRIERTLVEDDVDMVVTISNDQGVDVDRFSDRDLMNDFPEKAPHGNWFTFMAEIFEMARRQALKAEEAIDAILGELD